MLDEESTLVGEWELDVSCGRLKMEGGKGRNNCSGMEGMDELRCMDI